MSGRSQGREATLATVRLDAVVRPQSRQHRSHCLTNVVSEDEPFGYTSFAAICVALFTLPAKVTVVPLSYVSWSARSVFLYEP